jgi:hypothetical protein
MASPAPPSSRDPSVPVPLLPSSRDPRKRSPSVPAQSLENIQSLMNKRRTVLLTKPTSEHLIPVTNPKISEVTSFGRVNYDKLIKTINDTTYSPIKPLRNRTKLKDTKISEALTLLKK